jgi:PAS domain S-box-containing protein
MLQNLSEKVRDCLRRAEECGQRAKIERDPALVRDLLDIELRWLRLAHGYQFGESLNDFIAATPKPSGLKNGLHPYYVLQASKAAVYAKDRESRMIFANPGCLGWLGKSWSELHGRNDLEWHSDRTQARNVIRNDQEVIESEHTQVYEEAFDTPMGPRIILSTKSPLCDEDGKIIGIVGIGSDITDRKRQEQRSDFLQGELRHRLKNTLTLVQAMARGSRSPGDGFEGFERRLIAYARSQDMLLEGGGIVTLRQLIDDHGEALSLGNKLVVRGPQVNLPADIATEISIALHELVTNSLKYGALGSKGRVEIQWSVENNLLHLSWYEHHDQASSTQVRQGFGSKVLSSQIGQRLNGVSSYELSRSEVRWTLRVELPA